MAFVFISFVCRLLKRKVVMSSFCGSFICFLLVTCVISAPAYNSVSIVSQYSIITEGGYEFSYTLSDGQERYEKGTLTNIGDARIYEVSGYYSYVGTDGKTYRVNYTSGVNGYRATAAEVAKILSGGFTASINPAVVKSLIG